MNKHRNMDRSKQICAIIDLQGFSVGNQFFPREIAIVNKDLKLCYELDCDLDTDIIEENKGHLNYQRNHIHGIPIQRVLDFNTSRVFKSSNLEFIIENIYPYVKSIDKIYFAVKNHHLAKILDKINIPYINLEKETIGNEIVPPLHLFDKLNVGFGYHCPLHFALIGRTSYDRSLRCSLRKCLNIWNWLEMKITSNSFYNMLPFDEVD